MNKNINKDLISMFCHFFCKKRKKTQIEFRDECESPREKYLKYATASLIATGPCVGLTILACSVFPTLIFVFIVIGCIAGGAFFINSLRLYCEGFAMDDNSLVKKSFEKRINSTGRPIVYQ